MQKLNVIGRLSIMFLLSLPLESSVPALSPVFIFECGRKVRAAQGAPLLKVEAAGDGRCR